MNIKLFYITVLFFSIPISAYALETQDGDSCAGDPSGAVRITGGSENLNISETLICNGTIWELQSSCNPPSGCTSVGDVCADGSLFAGFALYNTFCAPFFVTDDNQSTASNWTSPTGTDDISTDDYFDGQVNHTNRGGTLADFESFDLCESSTYHSKSDWYLPSLAELNILWINRAAINANATGNFTTSSYWSSTEYSTSYGYNQSFNSGITAYGTKSGDRDVRCVRRD